MAPRLRALRHDRGARLIDVSAATGIPVSTLSRLESGQRQPNIRQILALATTYRVTTDELIGAPPSDEPRVTARPVTRDGKTLIPLTRRAGGIQILAPGEVAEFDTRLPHWIDAADAASVEVLALLGLQGERARVRARSRRVAGQLARVD